MGERTPACMIAGEIAMFSARRRTRISRRHGNAARANEIVERVRGVPSRAVCISRISTTFGARIREGRTSSARKGFSLIRGHMFCDLTLW
jgi:hypothetical protein